MRQARSLQGLQPARHAALGTIRRHCTHPARLCRLQQRCRQLPAAVAAAANTAEATADKRPRPKGRPSKRQQAEEEEPLQPPAEEADPELPTPLDYQQTLIKSFTIGGVGLHSGEYAFVRVRPAFAGEGRYFVRVPPGTNGNRFVFDEGRYDQKNEIPVEEALQVEPESPELEDAKVDWYMSYLEAQEHEGFVGTFNEYTQVQVYAGELDAKLRRAMLDIPDDEDDEPDVEPDLSVELEEIVPLDPDDPTLVMANISSVRMLGLPYTQLGEDDNRVMGVELLLAALEASGVDNARVEIEGGHEIPVLDNSALGWCIDIQCAGLRPAPVQDTDADADDEDTIVVRRDLIRPSEAVAVHDAEGWMTFIPSNFTKLTAGVDHALTAPIIGRQWLTWSSDDQHFRYTLAPARAYVESIEELFALRNAGFVKAGAENLFLIAAGDKWWDPDVVRMVYDEPVRYKLSQLIGNLSLLSMAGSQGLPVGHVTAYNANPSLQLSFAQQLFGSLKEDDITDFNDVLEKQQEFWQAKYGTAVVDDMERMDSTSVGAAGMDADSGGVQDVEAEVIDDDEEDETEEEEEEQDAY